LLLLAESSDAVVLPTLGAGVDVVENMESRRDLVVVDFFELLVLGVLGIAESEDCRTTFGCVCACFVPIWVRRMIAKRWDECNIVSLNCLTEIIEYE
jgi:hypothetical protein